jgi:tetratricopeptide (TPR) repeat protein
MEKDLNANELRRKGIMHLLNEEYDSAIDELTKAIELTPTYPDVNNALGVAHFFGGSREMAVEYFKRACEINPKYLEARLHLAYTAIELGDTGEGISLLDDFPQFATGEEQGWESYRVLMCDLHARLGELYEKRGEILEANGEYRKALKLQPQFLDVALKLARTYANLELFEDAHREFDRILIANPDYHEARMELGLLSLREGKCEEARRQWEKCLASAAHALRAKHYLRRLTRGSF